MVVKDEFGFTYPRADGDMEVKTYYRVIFPSDELGKNLPSRLTFNGLAKRFRAGKDIYKIVGVSDSVIRERLTHALQYVLNCSYDEIYEMDFLNYINGGEKK